MPEIIFMGGDRSRFPPRLKLETHQFQEAAVRRAGFTRLTQIKAPPAPTVAAVRFGATQLGVITETGEGKV